MAVVTLASCGDKDSEGLSRITYYPVIELNDGSFLKLNVGDTFTDPGFVATMGSDDVSDQVSVSGSVDTSTPGFYSISYSCVNPDGFAASATRTVMVANPNSFASAYLAKCCLNGREDRTYSNTPIVITKKGSNYEIDDLLGGYQFNGLNKGFDPPYDLHLEATLKLNGDNSIEVVSLGSWYFTTAVSLISGQYNPETGVIDLNLAYGANSLVVTLAK